MSLRSLRRHFRAWGRQQLYSLFSSLGSLLGHRLGTLMTVLVLGVAMALPLGLYVSVSNLKALDLEQERWGTVSVFMELSAGQEDARALADQIGVQHAADVVIVSPEQGLDEFRQASGFGQALEMFEDNPLPWVLHVTPHNSADEDLEARVVRLGDWLGQQGGVDLVQVDYKWLKRLAGLLELSDAFVRILAVVLSLAVIVVVANTIRLDVANRAGEIEVLHLVGAGNDFIRQPFLYSGFWYGLLGALLALVLLSVSLLYLNQPLERLLDAYRNSFEIHGLGVSGVLLVMLGGSVLGLLGAWLSVGRYLRQFRLEEVRRRK
jgi:cell division transport system permease protein